MSTSSSDRYEAARKVLAEYGAHDPRTVGTSGFHRSGEPVEPYNLVDTAAEMAAALRALIEPEPTTLSPEEIADRVAKVKNIEFDRIGGLYEMALKGVHAGIQAAWGSWEPETAPGEPARRVLTIPGAGIRVWVEGPREAYEQLTEMLATGYTFDEIQWEEPA